MWKTQVEKESALECWFGEGCHESSEMESMGVGEIAVRVG